MNGSNRCQTKKSGCSKMQRSHVGKCSYHDQSVGERAKQNQRNAEEHQPASDTLQISTLQSAGLSRYMGLTAGKWRLAASTVQTDFDIGRERSTAILTKQRHRTFTGQVRLSLYIAGDAATTKSPSRYKAFGAITRWAQQRRNPRLESLHRRDVARSRSQQAPEQFLKFASDAAIRRATRLPAEWKIPAPDNWR